METETSRQVTKLGGIAYGATLSRTWKRKLGNALLARQMIEMEPRSVERGNGNGALSKFNNHSHLARKMRAVASNGANTTRDFADLKDIPLLLNDLSVASGEGVVRMGKALAVF